MPAHSASGLLGDVFTVRFTIRQVSDGACLRRGRGSGSSWKGTFGEIESPHGLYFLRGLSAECGTRPGARRWVIWFVSAGHDHARDL